MPSFAAFGNQLYTGERSIDFIGRRRTWYLIAVLMILGSLVALGVRGLNPSIEFRGGSEFRISAVQDPSELIGQRAVGSVAPGAETRVSKLTSLQGNTKSVRVQTDKLTEAQTEQAAAALAKAYGVPQGNITTNFVGPSWGSDVSSKALQGLIVFLILVAGVISLYFRTWKMAAAALIALVHDLVITLGVYAAVGFEVSPASVIGFLTILGYSLYDTVVVFDKVRENTEHITATTRRTYAEAANLAVNQTLVRSINTSVVALLPVASILFIGAFLLGAGTLKDIALALLVGIAAGTYSSIFIATPLLVDLRRREPEIRGQEQRVYKRRAEAGLREEPVLVGAAVTASGALADSGGSGPVPGRGGGSGASGAGSSRTGTAGTRSTGDSTGAGTTAPSAAEGAGGAAGVVPSTPNPGGQRRQPRKGGRSRPGGKRR